MSASRTQTTTTTSTAGPSRSHPLPPPPAAPANPATLEDEGLEDKDEDNILRRAQEWIRRVRERKVAEAARKEAEEEAARAAAARRKAAQEAQEWALWAQQQEEVVTERRRVLATAVTAWSWQGTSPSEASVSLRRPVVEIPKGKGKAQPVGEDPDDEEKEPCKWCRGKKISCQMQAGKRSSIILRGRFQSNWRVPRGPREPDGSVTRGQLATPRGPVMDAARRRNLPLEMPEARPSGLSKKRRRVVDSDEEEEKEAEEEEEAEKEGEGVEEEEDSEAPAPKKAKTVASEKGKEKEV
ncbi:hypothetical protein EV368DRAFT_87237 [Lentinula lateritia]|nr:hypothetical protein EV368DRAFT_87237 [Lentinula lateritia]